MTKLFSMKSLAFAGAAAFALTLAAAPEADAAVFEPNVNYETGEFTVTGTGLEDGDLVETADGYGLYIGTNKDEGKFNEAGKVKYALVTDPFSLDTTGSSITSGGGITSGGAVGTKTLTFDISQYIGKMTYIGVALDEAGTDVAVAQLAESPNLKAKFNKEGVLEFTIGKGSNANVVSLDGLTNGYKYEYKVGTYGKWASDNALSKAMEKAKAFGSTIYVRIAGVGESGELTTPWSKEVKFKVSAKAKAPKIGVKTTNLTKAFGWKMGKKLEYIVTVNGKSSSEWQPGTDVASDWWEILLNAGVENRDTIDDMVAGDAIAADVTLQVRTAANGAKPASNIAVLKLKASLDSPLYSQIKVTPMQQTKGKNTVNVVEIDKGTDIPADYEAQYSIDGITWKKISNKAATVRADQMRNNNIIHVRLMSTKKNEVILPSPETIITFDSEFTKASASGWVKDTETGKWVEKTASDYTLGWTGTAGGGTGGTTSGSAVSPEAISIR